MHHVFVNTPGGALVTWDVAGVAPQGLKLAKRGGGSTKQWRFWSTELKQAWLALTRSPGHA